MQLVNYAETRYDGVWHPVGAIFKSTMKECEGISTYRPYDGRSRVLWEVLTGVHFNQNDSLTVLKPICDNLENQRIECGSYPNDYVGNYVTLKDILNYDWNQNVSNIGYISEYQYKMLKTEGRQPANIRDNPPVDVNIVSPLEMDMVLNNKDLKNEKKYWVKFEHNTRPLNSVCEFFYQTTIPSLMKLIPKGGTTEDVRFVYYLA